MAGPKDKKSDSDAFASFFGDDDFDWLEEEEEEVVAVPPAVDEGPATAASEVAAVSAVDESGDEPAESSDDPFGFDELVDDASDPFAVSVDAEGTETDTPDDKDTSTVARVRVDEPTSAEPPPAESPADSLDGGPTFRLDSALPREAFFARSPVSHTVFDPEEIAGADAGYADVVEDTFDDETLDTPAALPENLGPSSEMRGDAPDADAEPEPPADPPAPEAFAPAPEAFAPAPEAIAPATEAPAADALADAPTPDGPVADAPVADAPTAEAPAAVAPAPEAPTSGEPVAEEPVAAIPVVPAPEPLPVMEATPEDVEEEALPAPVTHLVAVRPIPASDSDAWHEAVHALEAEASASSGPDLARHLLELARVHLMRLNDPERARTALATAIDEGADGITARRLAVDIAMAAGDDHALLDALDALAATLSGETAAEVWRRGASLAHHLHGPRAAMDRLEKATEAGPHDLAAWWELRDLAVTEDADEVRVRALTAIAGLVSDVPGAAVQRELGLVLSSLGRDGEAIQALQKARDLDPSSGSVFRTLESTFQVRREHGALARLYEQEAGRWTGHDAAWWWLQAARAWRHAGEVDAATAAYASATGEGSSVSGEEQQAWLTLTERADDMVEAIQAEAERATDVHARAASWIRLALTQEILRDDPEAALAAYREAEACGVTVVQPAVTRLLAAVGDREILKAHLDQQIAAGGPDGTMAAIRRAELTEASEPSSEQALSSFRGLTREPSVSLRAWRGVARVARRRGDTPAVVEAFEALADASTDETAARDLRVRAVIAADDVGESVPALLGGTSPLLGLDLVADLLDGAERYEELAAHLERAAKLAVGADAATRWFNIARVRMLHLGNRAGAVSALQEALHYDRSHEGARASLVQLAGGLRPDLLLEASRAAAAAGGPNAGWHAYIAASIATLTHRPAPELDALDPAADAHSGMWVLSSIRAHETGDQERVRSLLSSRGLDDIERRLAWVLSVATVDPERARAALDEVQNVDRAHVAAARVAERLGNLDAAIRFASAGEGHAASLEAARLARRRGDGPDEVVAAAGDAASHELTKASVAHLELRAARQAGDSVRLAAAHSRSMELSEGIERAAHAAMAASRWAAAGHASEALAAHEVLLAQNPGSLDAFEAIRAARESAGDLGGIQALFDASCPEDSIGRAESLERAGDTARVAWEAAEAEHGLYAELAIEAALREEGDWRTLFERLSARRDRMATIDERERVEGRRRWVLAEKLAQTDEAFELYQQLHEERPEDKDVLESLARISGARGEDEVAIRYLRQLAEGTSDEVVAARYQRRIAEVHLQAGRSSEARQAFLDALDHRPDDAEALGGLKVLAKQADDWQSLMNVMQREAAIATGPRQVDLIREIAELTEQHVDDAAVVIDAWRRVLSVEPEDDVGRSRLLAVAETAGDHELFLQVAGEMVPALKGAALAVMLRRMGIANEAMNRREDAVHCYEQAMSAPEPDLDAATRLEALYRAANDWQGVVRALQGQAELLDDPDESAARLLAAARVELDVRHDREAASRMFEAVLGVDPHHLAALQFQAGFLFDAGRYVEAVPLCERLEPMLQASDDIDDFDERMELSTFFFRYAEMLRSARRNADALQRYEKALELNPTHLPSLEAVGPLYIAESQWSRAGDVFQRVLQLTGGRGDPQTVAQTYTMLGTVERQRGNAEKAYKRFNKALETFPNHVPALRGLALILEDRGEWNALLTVYNNIIYHATVPQDLIDAYMIKGRVLDEKLDRQDKAVQHYERSLSFYAQQPGVYLRLAELAVRRGAWEEVASYSVRGLEVSDGETAVAADLHVALAASRKGLGDHAGAQDAILGAMAADPTYEELLGSEPLGDLQSLARGLRERLPS